MVDKQNNSYLELWNEIAKHKKITICTHINADGDTIGSGLALKELILLNTDVEEVKISGEKIPRYLNFLPSNKDVDNNFFNESLKIVVDTSTRKRIFDKRVVTEEAIKIDHHHHEGKWLLEVGGDHWPAAGQVIWELIEDQKLKINDDIQKYIFISIWTDTEGMTQRNISSETRRIMGSLTIDKNDLLSKMKLSDEEKLVINAAPLEVKGDVSFSIVETKIPNDFYRQYVSALYERSETEVLIVGTKLETHYRMGLRSRGNIDISKYAKAMGGGGHFSSAGFTMKIDNSFNDKLNDLIKEINNGR